MSPNVKRLARAIAEAEGYFTGPKSLPYRANNPGDLEEPWRGLPTAKDVGMAESLITVFPTPEAGWAALYDLIELWFDGLSRRVKPDLSIYRLAIVYTETEQGAWAENVARALGVTTDTTIREISLLPPPAAAGTEA